MATRAPKKACKVPPCATPIDPAKDVTLPVVKSYALDIPTDPAELAQFDRSVSSIFCRITGRVATKTTKRKRVVLEVRTAEADEAQARLGAAYSRLQAAGAMSLGARVRVPLPPSSRSRSTSVSPPEVASGDKENVDPREVAALEENDDPQEGESKGYLSENSPGRSEVNDDDIDQEAFWAWQDNCECPKGTKRSQCSCERVPAYFAWVDNCTCDTNEMGRCTCGACAPQFKFAKR